MFRFPRPAFPTFFLETSTENHRRDVVETIKTLLKAAWNGKDIALRIDSFESWKRDGKQLR